MLNLALMLENHLHHFALDLLHRPWIDLELTAGVIAADLFLD